MLIFEVVTRVRRTDLSPALLHALRNCTGCRYKVRHFQLSKRLAPSDAVVQQTHMVLNFRGSQHFRQRLVCSTLSGKSICIRDIRAKDQDPGVRDYEASLLRLLEKITNGCVVEINETGM